MIHLEWREKNILFFFTIFAVILYKILYLAFVESKLRIFTGNLYEIIRIAKIIREHNGESKKQNPTNSINMNAGNAEKVHYKNSSCTRHKFHL